MGDFAIADIYQGFQLFAESITRVSLASNSTFPFETRPFPFVTLADFEEQGASLRSSSGAEVVIYAPLIATEQKQDFEAYAVENQGWIDASRAYAVANESLSPNIYVNGSIPSLIFGPGQSEIGPFLPIWQLTPPPLTPSIINYDLLQNQAWFNRMYTALRLERGT